MSGQGRPPITYREALREALIDEMAGADDVIVIGEDVGLYGGAYGVTKGLQERFGSQRVLDTPISEACIVGTAVGAAMTGLRPIAEIMYVDFAGLVMDQLANQAAKIRYMFGGQIGVPLVLRTQGGAGRSAAAQHSQSLESWFVHVPGLRVVMPATVNDAYHLLRQSLARPDPVVFVEHKGLYRTKGILDKQQPDGGWGQPVCRRQGGDVAIISYSKMLNLALEAAKVLSGRGIEAAVWDLRCLNPMDLSEIVDSVCCSGRAAVVTESCTTGGFAAEVASQITERCFDHLEEPVIRIGGEDVPMPAAPELESAAIPSVGLIADSVAWLVKREEPGWATQTP